MNELRNVKLNDIDSKSYQVKVVAGKAGKDLFTILPKHLLEPLRYYYKARRPAVYLFEGQRRGLAIDERRIQHFIQIYIAKIGLGGKDYSAHTLRHSFATHLPDTGTDIHTIKELPGHCNLATTMIKTVMLQNTASP